MVHLNQLSPLQSLAEVQFSLCMSSCVDAPFFSSVGHYIDPTGNGNWASYEIMWHELTTAC